MSLLHRLIGFALLLASASAATAEDREVPYWASIRVGEVNMRIGPAPSYHITWVYRRPQLPLKVVRIKEGWRLVEDPDGERGWVLGQFLSRDRTAVVRGRELAEMRENGSAGAKLMWRIEPGVVGKLGDCADGWCRLAVGPYAGFVREDRLWGVGEP